MLGPQPAGHEEIVLEPAHLVPHPADRVAMPPGRDLVRGQLTEVGIDGINHRLGRLGIRGEERRTRTAASNETHSHGKTTQSPRLRARRKRRGTIAGNAVLGNGSNWRVGRASPSELKTRSARVS